MSSDGGGVRPQPLPTVVLCPAGALFKMSPDPPSSDPAGVPAERSASPGRPGGDGPLPAPREDSPLTIGELEAGYSLYCKALRRLIQEGRSLSRIQRTVCWQRLARLHACLPSQYKDPEYLYLQLRRQNGAGET